MAFTEMMTSLKNGVPCSALGAAECYSSVITILSITSPLQVAVEGSRSRIPNDGVFAPVGWSYGDARTSPLMASSRLEGRTGWQS